MAVAVVVSTHLLILDDMIKLVFEISLMVDVVSGNAGKYKTRLQIINKETGKTISQITDDPELISGVVKSILNSFQGDYPIEGITLTNTAKTKIKAYLKRRQTEFKENI